MQREGQHWPHGPQGPLLAGSTGRTDCSGRSCAVRLGDEGDPLALCWTWGSGGAAVAALAAKAAHGAAADALAAMYATGAAVADGPQGAQEVRKGNEHEAHDKGSWRHGRSLGLQRPFARRMLGAGGRARIARRELLLAFGGGRDLS